MKEEKINKVSLSAKFKYIQKYFDMNNSDLAKIADVSPTAIRDIVEGVTENPKIGLIDKICKKLEINYEWFFEEDAIFLKSSIRTEKSNEDFKDKYYRAVELLALNGIRLDLGKTNGVLEMAICNIINKNFFGNNTHILTLH